jgi:hypothetical protein
MSHDEPIRGVPIERPGQTGEPLEERGIAQDVIVSIAGGAAAGGTSAAVSSLLKRPKNDDK